MRAAAIGRNARRTAVGLAASRGTPPLPDELHPVAWFGRLMGHVEQRLWRDDRWAGIAYTAIGTALGAAAGRIAGTTTTITFTTAGRQLRDTAVAVGDHLAAGDLDAARAALPALVGRDPSMLDESGVASAVIESVAENMVDAVFAPVWWGVVAGGAGAGAYRAVNTMDAVVGHRDERYARFGWASARLDDLANLVPARLFAVTVALVRPERRRAIAACIRADAAAHPSPNAGVAEAAMAAALGVELGGPLRYGSRGEDRPALGRGPRPTPDDIGRAVAVADAAESVLVGAVGLVGTVGLVAAGARARAVSP